jgi:hypothetical protein
MAKVLLLYSRAERLPNKFTTDDGYSADKKIRPSRLFGSTHLPSLHPISPLTNYSDHFTEAQASNNR